MTVLFDSLCLSLPGFFVCLLLQKIQGTNFLGDSFSNMGKIGVNGEIKSHFISQMLSFLQLFML